MLLWGNWLILYALLIKECNCTYECSFMIRMHYGCKVRTGTSTAGVRRSARDRSTKSLKDVGGRHGGRHDDRQCSHRKIRLIDIGEGHVDMRITIIHIVFFGDINLFRFLYMFLVFRRWVWSSLALGFVVFVFRLPLAMRRRNWGLFQGDNFATKDEFMPNKTTSVANYAIAGNIQIMLLIE